MPAQHRVHSVVFDVSSGTKITILAIAFLLSIMAAPQPAQGQGLYVMYYFSGGTDGFGPAGLTMDSAGNFYGTLEFAGLFSFSSQNGLRLLHTNAADSLWFGPDHALYGAYRPGNSDGYVFKLAPPANVCVNALCSWQEGVLFTFSGNDGANPVGPLVYDREGNMYGVTTVGGANNGGVIFRLTPSPTGWTESVLYNLPFYGSGPESPLIFDKHGNLFGTIWGGGIYGDGEVFELSPSGSGWTEKTIHSFQGATEGDSPCGTLVFDGAGNLYGTNYAGGPHDMGTVYELSPSTDGSWTFTRVHNFDADFGPCGLTMDSAGKLYGTAVATLYELSPSDGNWTYTLLHAFTNGGDGGEPTGNLQLDPQGNLWGTTEDGGFGNCFHGCGVIYKYEFQ